MATFYVASAFGNKEKVAAIVQTLRAMGHKVSHDWTQQEHAYTQHAAIHAQEDREGVEGCTHFVALFDEPLRSLNTYVELGIALGLHKQVYVIGDCDSDCIFSRLPGIKRIATLAEFMALAKGGIA